jgi:photosystem II protein PsbQ
MLRSFVLVILLPLVLVVNLIAPAEPALAANPVISKIQAEVEHLQELVDNQEWVNVRSYIHGPMGMTRKELASLALGVTGEQQKQIQKANRQVLTSLEKIDAAAEDFDAQRLRAAQNSLRDSLAALDALLGS